MQHFTGQLGTVSLKSVLQLIEMNKLTGSLMVKHKTLVKNYYLQDGKMVFVWSENDGEQLWNYLEEATGLKEKPIKKKIHYQDATEKPLLDCIIKSKLATREQMEMIMQMMLSKAINDSINRNSGSFSFSDSIPPRFRNNSIRFCCSDLLMNLIATTDEINSLHMEQPTKGNTGNYV